MTDRIGLAELRVFLVLVDELHFGRAADRLGLTQSRVSQTLRQLERHLGGRLLERSNRTTSLTPFGRRVRDAVSEPYTELQAVLAALRAGSGVEAGLRIGLLPQTSSTGSRWLEILDTFRQEQPLCPVTIVDLTLTDFFGPLERGEVHVICTRLPVRRPGISIGPLLSDEPRVLLVARDHELARRSEVSVEVLADHALVDAPSLPEDLAEHLLPRRTPSGRPIPRGPTVGSMTEVLAAVARGVVVHPTARSTPQYRAHPMVTSVPLVDAERARGALAFRTSDVSPATRAFVDVASRVMASVPPRPVGRRQKPDSSRD